MSLLKIGLSGERWLGWWNSVATPLVIQHASNIRHVDELLLEMGVPAIHVIQTIYITTAHPFDKKWVVFFYDWNLKLSEQAGEYPRNNTFMQALCQPKYTSSQPSHIQDASAGVFQSIKKCPIRQLVGKTLQIWSVRWWFTAPGDWNRSGAAKVVPPVGGICQPQNWNLPQQKCLPKTSQMMCGVCSRWVLLSGLMTPFETTNGMEWHKPLIAAANLFATF